MFERRFISKSQKQTVENHLFTFIQGQNFEWEKIRDQVIKDEKLQNKLPWYLFRKESVAIQLWEVIVSIPLVFYIIFLPLHVSTDSTFHARVPEGTIYLYIIFEAIWYVDIILSFCKVPVKLTKPTLW